MTDYPSDNLALMKGHVVHGGYDELIRYIGMLLHNEEFRKKEGEAMQELMAEYSVQRDADQVIAVCKNAVRNRYVAM